MDYLEIIGETFITVLRWISQVFEAMIDCGLAGPSEWAIIGFGIAFIFYIKRKVFRK